MKRDIQVLRRSSDAKTPERLNGIAAKACNQKNNLGTSLRLQDDCKSDALLHATSLSFVFRCDGSTQIGMGHVMRCRTLAQALREGGHRVHFVMRDLPGHAAKTIDEAGFEMHLIRNEPRGSLSDSLDLHGLPSTHDSIGSPHYGDDRLYDDSITRELTRFDLDEILRTARKVGADWILVDHYGASPQWIDGLRREKTRIAVIDDLADRDLTAADWILNQNLNASNLSYMVRPECTILTGPRYALLRPQFFGWRRRLQRDFSPASRRILITLGGGETSRLCAEILHSLSRIRPPVSIRCILGGTQTMPASAVQETRATHELEILDHVDDMAEEMAWADISINAGGSTCWELCCLGVPMIVLVTSKDQQLIASSLEQNECGYNLGKWDPTTSPSLLLTTTEALLEDVEQRALMSSKASSLVDGLGARRVAESLTGLTHPQCGVAP